MNGNSALNIIICPPWKFIWISDGEKGTKPSETNILIFHISLIKFHCILFPFLLFICTLKSTWPKQTSSYYCLCSIGTFVSSDFSSEHVYAQLGPGGNAALYGRFELLCPLDRCKWEFVQWPYCVWVATTALISTLRWLKIFCLCMPSLALYTLSCVVEDLSLRRDACYCWYTLTHSIWDVDYFRASVLLFALWDGK